MRKLIFAAALGAIGLSTAPALAQPYNYGNYGQHNRDYRHDVRDARHDCHRAMRNADNRWEYRRAREICQRASYETRRQRWWDGHHWRYR